MEDGRGGLLRIAGNGSRVIGLQAAGSSAQAFWHNEQWEPGDWNLGGDRFWISPELDFFQPSPGEYVTPAALDPGAWTVSDASAATATCELACTLSHPAGPVSLRLARKITLAPNPLTRSQTSQTSQASGASRWQELAYIGYEQETTLHVAAPESDLPSPSRAHAGYCNLWSIMQVPEGGIAYAGAYGADELQVMFGDQPQAVRMEPTRGGIRVPFTGTDKFKLSLDALLCTGRMGYVRQLAPAVSSLVIRQFHVNPSAIYPDYMPGNPGQLGSCLQLFYDGKQMGGFGELEYHAPALPLDREGAMSDRSQTYFYVGNSELIDQLAAALLTGDR